MFCHFWQKFENSKWPPFLGRGNFLQIAKITFLRYPVGRKFRKIALSHTVKEIEANLCFAIFGKNSKIQNGRHFWGGEHFFENCKDYISYIPCGSKISTKSLYLAWLKSTVHEKKGSLKICKCVPESKTILVKKTRHQSEHPPLRYSLSKWHLK